MFSRFFIAFVAFSLISATLVGVGTGSPGLAVLSLLLGSAFGGVLAASFSRSFGRPLREIQATIASLTTGNRDQRIVGGAWRESRDLAHGLNEFVQQRNAEIQHLQSERQQLRAILGSMTEGVVAVGPGQRVLFANEAAGRLLDFDAASALDRPLYELTRQAPIQTILELALQSGKPHREQMEFKKPASRHVSVFVAPLKDSSGAILVLDDISELRRLERLRQDFVANVSHELKTPLTVMKACVETLQDGAVEDPEARGPFLQQIAEGAERLHALILDLLSLARIESGEEIFEFDSLPVNEVVEVSLERFRHRAEAKQLNLQAIPAPQALTVWADSEAVGQILDNLIDNAVKYTPDGGCIRICWSAAGKNVKLSVEDTGPGIPERDLSRIFERFYRVDKARARQLGGTGLGLSIVKHLIQSLNGTVNATSTLGQGSTFTISLPRTEN